MTDPTPVSAARAVPSDGWDCHVHVFDADAPLHEGHYRPVDRPLAAIESVAAAHGVGHLVLVQPSVYGVDNTVMLAALRAGQGRHRGVAVVDASIDERALDAMHAAGVRGLRLNLVSPVGMSGDPADFVRRLGPRLHERGWHLQWYADATALPAIAALAAGTAHTPHTPPFVLDHLAGMRVGLPAPAPAWAALDALAGAGAWVKLSGWYRLGAQAPYAGLHDTIGSIARRFGDRMVWGSDWPHTSFAPDAQPSYPSTWHPVETALGVLAACRVREAFPAALYC